ncbi:TPA: DUF2726 domain-containing protein [Salmonella enterica subsp. enterica serovar Newport]
MFDFESVILFVFLVSIILFVVYFDFPYIFKRVNRNKDIVVSEPVSNQSIDLSLPSDSSCLKHIFYRKKEFLPFPDIDFYKPLYDLLGEHYYILYKTYFFDIFDCVSSVNGNEFKATPHNPLFYYYFDFVIVRKKDCSIACAIELNESLFKDKGGIPKNSEFYKTLKDNQIYFIRANSKEYLIDKMKIMLSMIN